jgi:hypothetical protein
VSIPVPTSDVEAMDMYRTGLSYLAAADPTAMAAQAQAEFLQAFEQGDAMSTAARAQILVAFTASQGYSADADYSPTSWLIHRTRVTKGAARGHLGWARRAVTHPDVLKALAEGTVVSESMARTICQWTDKLPEACRPAADDPDRRRGRRSPGRPRRPGRGDLRPVPHGRPRRPARPGFRGPSGSDRDHLRGCRGDRR